MLQEIFDQLSSGKIRYHLLLSWAKIFQKDRDQPKEIIELIQSITTLDFSYNRSLTPRVFLTILSLPFSDKLAHLHLTRTIASLRPLAIVASSPVLNNLVTLNLKNTCTEYPADLISGRNTFPRLEKLNLANNSRLRICEVITPHQFPNLKSLSARNIQLLARTAADLDSMRYPLEELDLGGNNALGDTHLLPLLETAPLQNLKKLIIPTTSLGLKTIQSIVDNESFENLEVLDFGGNRDWMDPGSNSHFNDNCLKQLSDTPILSNLRELYIGNCRFGNEGLEALGTSKYLKNLNVLDLSGMLAMCSVQNILPYLPIKLSTLDLSRSTVSMDDFEALLKAPCMQEIQHLSLCSICIPETETEPDNVVLDQMIRKLAQSPIISNLISLDLSHHDAFPSAAVVKELLTAPHMSNNLTTLRLTFWDSNDIVVEAMATQLVSDDDPDGALRFGKLEVLSLAGCGLGVPSFNLLALSPAFRFITRLNISDNYNFGFGKTEAPAFLSDLNPFPSLVELNLKQCSLGDAFAFKLARSPMLEHVLYANFNANDFTREGIAAILKAPQFSEVRSILINPTFMDEALEDDIFELVNAYLTDCESYRDYL